MPTNIDVSIIIVNYNTLNYTLSCINSIYEHTSGVVFEIIVIDNSSNDNSQIVLAADKRIIFIETKSNLGFGKANNLGLNISKGNYIFFLNSDTYLINNAIYIFWKYCETSKKKQIGAVGCLLTNCNNQRCHSYAKLVSAYEILISYAIAPFYPEKAKQVMGVDNYIDEYTSSFEVGYVTGADLFVHRSVLNKCGIFDNDFFMYSEEAELQWRFKSHGYKNIVINGPKIVHLEGKSQKESRNIPMVKILMIQKSLFLFIKKTSSLSTYCFFRFSFVIVRIPFIVFSHYSIKEKVKYITLLFS